MEPRARNGDSGLIRFGCDSHKSQVRRERERESAPAWPLEQSSPMHSLVTQTEVSGSAGPGDPLESSIPLAARVARAQEVPIHCVQPCTRG
jgi:hypothetical protein